MSVDVCIDRNSFLIFKALLTWLRSMKVHVFDNVQSIHLLPLFFVDYSNTSIAVKRNQRFEARSSIKILGSKLP